MPEQALTVSVVMCTHNGMEFIEDQLESILSQSYPPSELIVSDDNSTDGTLEFVTEYVNNYIATHPALATMKFQTISNVPALGVTKNFEAAIAVASGDLIALSDQDDVWMPEKILHMAKEFDESRKLLLLHSDAELVDSRGNNLGMGLLDALSATRWEKKLALKGNEFPILLRRNLVTGATTIFRNELVTLTLPVPPEFLHDEWFALVAASEGQARLIPKKLVKYRQHSSNVVGVTKLGLRHAIGRVLFPRTERNKVLLDRAKALVGHPYFCEHSSRSGQKPCHR